MVGGKALMVRYGAGLDELADLGVEVFADPLDREPFRGREVRDPLGGVRDGFRGVAVGADLERVLALDLEEVADFGKHTRDSQVVEAHGCSAQGSGLNAQGSRQNPEARSQCSSLSPEP